MPNYTALEAKKLNNFLDKVKANGALDVNEDLLRRLIPNSWKSRTDWTDFLISNNLKVENDTDPSIPFGARMSKVTPIDPAKPIGTKPLPIPSPNSPIFIPANLPEPENVRAINDLKSSIAHLPDGISQIFFSKSRLDVQLNSHPPDWLKSVKPEKRLEEMCSKFGVIFYGQEALNYIFMKYAHTVEDLIDKVNRHGACAERFQDNLPIHGKNMEMFMLREKMSRTPHRGHLIYRRAKTIHDAEKIDQTVDFQAFMQEISNEEETEKSQPSRLK